MVTLCFKLARYQTFIMQNKTLIESLQLDNTFFSESVILVFNNFDRNPNIDLIRNFLDRRIDLYRFVVDRYDDYYFHTTGLPPPSRDLISAYETVLYGILALLTDIHGLLLAYRFQTSSILDLNLKGQHGELII